MVKRHVWQHSYKQPLSLSKYTIISLRFLQEIFGLTCNYQCTVRYSTLQYEANIEHLNCYFEGFHIYLQRHPAFKIDDVTKEVLTLRYMLYHIYTYVIQRFVSDEL